MPNEITINISTFQELYDTGLHPIPVLWDTPNKKAKRHPEHKTDIQSGNGKPDIADIKRWYNDLNQVNGIALALYPPAFMFDFDLKNTTEKNIFIEWYRMIEATNSETLRKLCIESTKSGGYHVYGKHSNVTTKKMLARANDGKEVISIYTGGLLSYCYPTPGYKLKHNDFSGIEFLTDDEFDFLSIAAIHFDKYKPGESDYTPGEITNYPDEHKFLLRQFDKKCTDDLFEKLLNAINLYKTRLPIKRFQDLSYHSYLRKGSTSSYSAKVCFAPKRVLFFSASYPKYPSYHTRKDNNDKSWSLTPSLLIYYNHNKEWEQTIEIIKEVCEENSIELNTTLIENNDIEQPQSTAEEIELLRQKAKIDLSKKVSEPPVFLEIFCTGVFQRFATAGNFSLIIGKAKSRKTFFICLIVAALIQYELLMGKFMPRVPDKRKKIIVFDTEQAIYDVQTLNERILKIAGLSHCNDLEIYHLRTFDTKQRIDVIEYTLYNTPGLSAVIIDGIRDLIFDINDPQQATYISNKLLKWTEELNIHIVTVLHQNKADNNARGHVGTELINKAESVLSVAKDQKQPELSIVTPEYFKGKEFKTFAFRINEGGLPEITDEFLQIVTSETGQQRKTILAHQIPDEKHREIISGIFENSQEFHYKDAVNQIKLALQAYGERCGDNKAIEILTYYLNKNWIKKEPAKPYAVYKVVPL